jgi:tol-pal system protein YbgF
LSRLESAVQDLQGAVYSVEQSAYGSASSTASGGYSSTNDYGGDMTVRVSQLERELQSLTGRIEQVAYQIDQNSRRLDTITAALSTGMPSASAELSADEENSFNAQYDRMTTDSGLSPATEGPTDLSGTGAFSGKVEEPSVAMASIDCSGAIPTDANGTYDYAFDALLNGDYLTAECAFQMFMDTYPSDPRAPDAQFRLGEIYLATGANVDAAKAFLNHIKTWPNDARAPESYLKLGTAYSRLDKRQEACKVFDVMRAKFPNLSSSVRQRLAAERGAAGC